VHAVSSMKKAKYKAWQGHIHSRSFGSSPTLVRDSLESGYRFFEKLRRRIAAARRTKAAIVALRRHMAAARGTKAAAMVAPRRRNAAADALTIYHNTSL
jgi:hypothetical protein